MSVTTIVSQAKMNQVAKKVCTANKKKIELISFHGLIS